jgi:HD-GYP domain-containing protein (c-di-GMP phosphodiesterase class II)
VLSLLELMSSRDPALRLHSEQVARMAVWIGLELSLPPLRLEVLRRAALLHDVGKLAVPDSILQKPGPLTQGEHAVVMRHVEWGYRIVSGIGLRREAHWVLHHHERPDGRGYPHRLSGDQIPTASRILHVADAFDALTAARPYRAALGPDDALAEIQAGTGTDFDFDCVAALSVCLR